jgi:hypothetical protein
MCVAEHVADAGEVIHGLCLTSKRRSSQNEPSFPRFSASSVSSSFILASKARDRESTDEGGGQATHDGRSPVPPNKARSGRAVFVRHPSYAGRRPYRAIRLGVSGRPSIHVTPCGPRIGIRRASGEPGGRDPLGDGRLPGGRRPLSVLGASCRSPHGSLRIRRGRTADTPRPAPPRPRYPATSPSLPFACSSAPPLLQCRPIACRILPRAWAMQYPRSP